MVDMETTATLTAPQPTRPETQDDRELVARFRAGETDAFERIVAAHQLRITRLVHRLLDRSDGTDDVIQEVFLAVLQNLGRFRGKSKMSTWMTTIAVNKCRSHGRRRRLWLRVLPWLAKNAESCGEPSDPLEATESHQQIRRAVQRLSTRYREPIVLRYFEEMSVAEIADVLGISHGAVEVRLSRARGKLKEILAPRPNEGSP